MLMLPTDWAPKHIEDLFLFLETEGYFWNPLSPEQLLRHKKKASNSNKGLPTEWSDLQNFFGLGIGNSSGFGIAKTHSFFCIFQHWDYRAKDRWNTIYLGAESIYLLNFVLKILPILPLNKRMEALELGAGAGITSLELSKYFKKVRAIDTSSLACKSLELSSKTQKINNLSIHNQSIEQEQILPANLIVFNPPLALSKTGNKLPDRDAGVMGTELPLHFLKVARKNLQPGGYIACLLPIPILNGEPLLEFYTENSNTEIIEMVKHVSYFNHRLYLREKLLEQTPYERFDLYTVLLKAK